METLSHSTKDLMCSKGFKNTKEREILLKELEILTDHFNAENLHARLTRKGLKVSKPTIYRTLKLLEKLRLIKRFDIRKNCFYYESVFHKGDHGHLICEKCGKIVDFSMGDVDTLKSAIIKKKNFTPGYVSIRVFGLCQSCRRGRSGHAVKAGRAQDVN